MANQDKKNEDDSQKDNSSNPSGRPDMMDQSAMQERLGFGLRSMYRSVLEEPLPDDMMALLDQLEEAENSTNENDAKKDRKNS